MDSAGALGTATVHILPVQKSDPTSNMIALTRLPNGTVRLVFAGVPGRSYVIQASASLANPGWTKLGTMMAAPNGLVTFEDKDAPNHANRFYRTISTQ